MNLILTNPLGLLGLLALPAIVWLHRYVVRGKVHKVSCLALWTLPGTIGIEGSAPRRPPVTWVLLLELLAALLLTLLLAGFDVVRPHAAERRVAVIVDGSASMAGGGGGNRAIDVAARHLAALDSDLAVNLFISGVRPQRLGGSELNGEGAAALLRRYQPSAPHHSLTPTFDLLAAAGFASHQVLVFSDDPELEHPRLVRVGKAVANVGIVGANWPSGAAPFVVVRRFGDAPDKLDAQLVIKAGEQPSQTLGLDFKGREELPLRLTVPVGVNQIEVRLPDDLLEADNRVHLVRPQPQTLRVRLDHPHPAVRRAVARLARALPDPRLRVVESGRGDVVVSDRRPSSARGFALVFKQADAPQLLSTDPLVVDPFSPLTEGLDVRGLVWFGDRRRHNKRALLQAGRTPLVWQESDRVIFQLDLDRSNLFEHSAFPILMANVARALVLSRGGLPRNHWRVGEELSYRRSARCDQTPVLHTPAGEQRKLLMDEGMVNAGWLDQPGLYRVECGDLEELVAVNLLDAHEGALHKRVKGGATPELRPTVRGMAMRTSSAQRWLFLVAGLSLITAWLLLRFRRSPA